LQRHTEDHTHIPTTTTKHHTPEHQPQLSEHARVVTREKEEVKVKWEEQGECVTCGGVVFSRCFQCQRSLLSAIAQ